MIILYLKIYTYVIKVMKPSSSLKMAVKCWQYSTVLEQVSSWRVLDEHSFSDHQFIDSNIMDSQSKKDLL